MEAGTTLGGFNGLYGLEVTEHGDGVVRARVAVGEQHKQPAGLVHGGVFAAMAEAAASLGTYLAVHDQGRVAMGQANHTSFLRPVVAGHVHALARARHRGRTTWVWDVEFSDDDERLCALSRVTIAVRDAPPGAVGGGSGAPDQPR